MHPEQRGRFLQSEQLRKTLWASVACQQDLLDQGGGSAEHYCKIFIVAVFAEGDGLLLLPDTIRVGRIRDEEEYDSVRVFAC